VLLGCIADDSTGASDLANTLAKGGMRTLQFIGIPRAEDAGDCEAAVIALKTRSIAAEEAVRQSCAALERLLALGCRQIVFKICSTFDSTPAGNIGPVAEALAAHLCASTVPVCPAFPGAGRTVYQGHLFVSDRLLSESGMEEHPLNPMTDPDIRRWLRLQANGDVGHVPFATICAGPEAIRAALASERGGRLVICDAISDENLIAIGEAAADLPLLVGGSGIALGLPANFARKGLLHAPERPFSGVDGPGCVLAGSCSAATLGQVAAYAAAHPDLAVDVTRAVEDRGYADAIVAFVQERLDDEPLVHSSAGPEAVDAAQRQFGREQVAQAVEDLFGAVAVRLVRSGLRRLVVAGGETSGSVMAALGVTRLAVGPEIDPGVPALIAEQPVRIALALKSGNFGARDFFGKALAVLGSKYDGA
jgi:uncharacterized protein YgbK (DUF1537 family)